MRIKEIQLKNSLHVVPSQTRASQNQDGGVQNSFPQWELERSER
jgi:hypothetical protein